MSQARTARRRRKQMAMNNAQWTGLRVPRYGGVVDATAAARRLDRKKKKWKKTGSQYAGG